MLRYDVAKGLERLANPFKHGPEWPDRLSCGCHAHCQPDPDCQGCVHPWRKAPEINPQEDL